MKTEIFKTYAEFLARPDKHINGVSPEFAKANPTYAKEKYNSACWSCAGCSDCSPVKTKDAGFVIPKIENIHQAIIAAVEQPNALDMETWHTCQTTHCRGGWVIKLAGKELEAKTSAIFAAMMIYKESSAIKVPPPRFYESNDVAMADMRRCAAEEAAAEGKEI